MSYIPGLPNELCDEVLDWLVASAELPDLFRARGVSRKFTQPVST
jgi:hypothetical protein